MASNDADENNFMKKTHKEDQYESSEVTSDYHRHRSLLPVNDSLKAPKRKRSRNGLTEETNKVIKKQKLEDNSSVEKTLKNNCDDESPRSYHDDNRVYPNSSRDYSEQCNDKISSWNTKYQALNLRMKKLSKEIDKYMHKTLRSKSKKEEINSLFSGHTPVPEKHIPTTVSQLDHSGIKINELCTKFLKDPRSCKPSNLYCDMDVSRVSENNASIEPKTIHDPATEILASLNSHAPIPYEMYPITKQPPDYSGFKINKIHSDILKDPRLGKFSKLYSGINVSGVPEYSLLTESESETEIKGSCNSHAPTQYKLIQISIPLPDYSGFKVNKLHSEIMKDPRLHNPSNLYSCIEVSGIPEDNPPIEPITINEPVTEVITSLNNYAPNPYNHSPIIIQPPDNSGFKINELHTDIFKELELSQPSKLYSSIDESGVPESIPQITPTPIQEPVPEVITSLNNYAPNPYNHSPIIIQPPDNSGFKMNELHTDIFKELELSQPSKLYSSIDESRVPESIPQITLTPTHEPATEVNGLSNSHALIPYNHIPITIPHLDYSGLQMNIPKQVLKDQRSCTPSKIYSSIVGRGVPTYCRLIKRAHFYKPVGEINASSNRHAQIQFNSVQYTRILIQKSIVVKKNRTIQ